MTNPTPDDAHTARQARRDALNDLITRIGRGRAGADISVHLANHLNAELADADQAHAALVDARYELEGETKRADRAEAEVKRLGLMVDEYGTGVSGLSEKLRTERERAEKAEQETRAYRAAAEQAEQLAENMQGRATAMQARAERAEAAITRVRAQRDLWRTYAHQAVAGQRTDLPDGEDALDGEQPAEPEPAACTAYQPPTTPEDSGLCAHCGMADWKHTAAPNRAAPEIHVHVTVTPEQVRDAVRHIIRTDRIQPRDVL